MERKVDFRFGQRSGSRETVGVGVDRDCIVFKCRAGEHDGWIHEAHLDDELIKLGC